MTVLKIMCGCPGAGKTTFIETHKKPTDMVISRDLIRQSCSSPGIPYFSKENEVFYLLCQAINNTLLPPSYDTVWVDATHLNHGSRNKLISNIYASNFEKIVFICIETPLDVCLERNATRDSRTRVPESAIKSMYESYKRPTLNEFDYLNVEIEVIK